MSYQISRKNQELLLGAAAILTGSNGWAADAVAFSLKSHGASEDDPIIAVMVFQRFEGRDAEMHIGVPTGGKVTRGIMDAVKTLAFNPRALNLNRMWTTVSVENKKTLALTVISGAEIEYRKRAGMPGGEDAIVFSMARASRTPAARAESERT